MFYAEIKKTSRRANQRSWHLDDNDQYVPFPVEINTVGVLAGQGAVKGGIGGNYHLNEVTLFVKNNNNELIKVK